MSRARRPARPAHARFFKGKAHAFCDDGRSKVFHAGNGWPFAFSTCRASLRGNGVQHGTFNRRASRDDRGRVGFESTRPEAPLAAPSLRPPPPPPPPPPEQVFFLLCALDEKLEDHILHSYVRALSPLRPPPPPPLHNFRPCPPSDAEHVRP